MSASNKSGELKAIAEEISVCLKCPLSKSRTKTVPGSGSAEAEVMFVGEAPGFNEDQQGIPFCGAAGKFLDEMLSNIGYTRDQVFIANTLKCRPPENRDPEDSEKDACKSYLERQIEIINPKLIVCLGRHSVTTFMPGAGGISKLHGHAVKRPNGRVYLALYHPAAALHNGSLRQTLVEDFGKIPAILTKIDQAGINQKTGSVEDKSTQQKLL